LVAKGRPGMKPRQKAESMGDYRSGSWPGRGGREDVQWGLGAGAGPRVARLQPVRRKHGPLPSPLITC
jgi:hypothetical protein